MPKSLVRFLRCASSVARCGTVLRGISCGLAPHFFLSRRTADETATFVKKCAKVRSWPALGLCVWLRLLAKFRWVLSGPEGACAVHGLARIGAERPALFAHQGHGLGASLVRLLAF